MEALKDSLLEKTAQIKALESDLFFANTKLEVEQSKVHSKISKEKEIAMQQIEKTNLEKKKAVESRVAIASSLAVERNKKRIQESTEVIIKET